MLLTVTCPVCQTQYQVDPALRGKRMRCKNTICMTVFEVTDGTPPTPPPEAPPGPEPAPRAETTSPTAAPLVPPPVRRGKIPADKPPARRAPPVEAPSETPAARRPDTPETAPKAPRAPAAAQQPEAEPAWKQPPPVRDTTVTATLPPPATDEFPDDFPDDDPSPTTALSPPSAEPPAPPTVRPRHHARTPALVVLGLFLALAGMGIYLAKEWRSRTVQLESERFHEAEKAYGDGDFTDARRRFQALQKDYPESKDLPRYRTFAMLSDLRAELDAAQDPASRIEFFDRVRSFVEANRQDPLVKEHRTDLWDTLSPLTKRLADDVEEKPDENLLRRAREAWELARPFAAGPVAKQEEALRDRFQRAEVRLTAEAQRRDLFALLESAREQPTVDRVREAAARVKEAPPADKEVAAAWSAVLKAHQAAIIYRKADESKSTPVTERYPPQFPQATAMASDVSEPVPALSPTGVLYAFEPKKGELRWLARLGIDARLSPRRVIASPGGAPGWLTVFADRMQIALLDPFTGRPRWQHPVPSPCVVDPIVAGDRILVPLQSGRVDDLELSTGELRGSFRLDQPPEGAVAAEGGIVLITGQAECVYFLDVPDHKCVDIVYTGHPAGSLRGPPFLVENHFVVCQAEGGPRLSLRPVLLPGKVERRNDKPLHVAGSASFAPWQNGESLALATDDGRLHLVGKGLSISPSDPVLFPLTPADTLLASIKRDRADRAQVIHADGDSYWVIAQAHLHRMQKAFSAQTGPVLQARWPQPPWVGEPLHVAAIRQAGDEAATLFLVTRAPDRPIAWLSAIDADTGKTHWKRPLGTVPLGPVVASGEQLAWEDAAGIYFQVLSPNPKTLGHTTLVPLPRARDSHHRLVHRNRDWLRLAWTDTAKSVHMQEFAADGSPRKEREVVLPSVPASGPAEAEGVVVLALRNGALVRIDLADDRAVSGPDWRAAGAEHDATAHVLALDAATFVATDGRHGVTAFHWSEPKNGKELARIPLPKGRRPVSLFALGGPERRLLVVDDTNMAHLVDTRRWQRLAGKTWDLGGRVTQGPIAVGQRAVAVVDRKRLVCLDPDRNGFAWEYTFPAELVGAPQVAEGRLILADIDGSFWMLAADTGANLAPGDEGATLSLDANLAAAVAPVPLPGGRLFVLWSDGTGGILPQFAK